MYVLRMTRQQQCSAAVLCLKCFVLYVSATHASLFYYPSLLIACDEELKKLTMA
jgi:hypothetical protein